VPKPPGVFCLEGDWTERLTDRLSVEPQLRMLAKARHCADVIHRDVATREEFAYYLDKWLAKRYESFGVGYMAFHGASGLIELGRDVLTLDEIAEMVRGRGGGRTVYFGACETLSAPDEELKRFCAETGFKALVGYTKYVDWLEAAAFDFILLPQLLRSSYAKPIYERLRRDHERFVTGLGFRLATKTWVSPRKYAVAALRS
jgi:hypothetical protein